MRTTYLAGLAGAVCAMLVPQAMAQGVTQAPADKLQGAHLRRVATPDNGRLVYEYQAGTGTARLSIDPGSLVRDIERARKRVARQKADAKLASVTLAAPLVPVRQPDMIQAELAAPVLELAPKPAPQVNRKVRVIQLYNVPGVDER